MARDWAGFLDAVLENVIPTVAVLALGAVIVFLVLSSVTKASLPSSVVVPNYQPPAPGTSEPVLPGSEVVTPSCLNECQRSGQVRSCASASALRQCGDFNGDGCLVWGAVACPSGQSCVDGQCQSALTGAICGNGICQSTETCSSCPGDCGSCSTCGNGVCGTGETCTSCPSDCGVCPQCGNGICSSAETCSSCPADCGTCVCTNGETQACHHTNSVGTCEGIETCNNNNWVNCSASTPVAEICGDGIDNDCDGQTDEGCFTRLKVLWVPYSPSSATIASYLHTTRSNGFSEAIGVVDYPNGNVMTPPLQYLASSAQQEGLGLIPKITFSYQYQVSGVSDYTALFYDGTQLVDSNMIAPLSAAYWDNLTSMLVQLATLSKSSMPSIRGSIFDFEMYNHYDIEYYYFTYDGSFDTGTFQAFITAHGADLVDPPVSQDRRFERYTWLTSQNQLDAYHAFVAQLAQSRAQSMANAVYAVNPDFLIGMYPSPLWNNGRYHDPPSYWHYWYPIFFDWYRGWDTHSRLLLFGTETYGCSDSSVLPGHAASNGRFDLVRQDTSETTNLYYSSGYLMGHCTAPQISRMQDAAAHSNGYWIFDGAPLLQTCSSLVEGNERINICQAGIPSACCTDPYSFSIADYRSTCCGAGESAYNAAVAEYWADLNAINHQLPP